MKPSNLNLKFLCSISINCLSLRSCGLWQSTDVILSGGLGGHSPGHPALDNATIIGK